MQHVRRTNVGQEICLCNYIFSWNMLSGGSCISCVPTWLSFGQLAAIMHRWTMMLKPFARNEHKCADLWSEPLPIQRETTLKTNKNPFCLINKTGRINLESQRPRGVNNYRSHFTVVIDYNRISVSFVHGTTTTSSIEILQLLRLLLVISAFVASSASASFSFAQMLMMWHGR